MDNSLLLTGENARYPWAAVGLTLLGAFALCLMLQVWIDPPIVQWSHGLEGTKFFLVASRLTDFGKSTWYLITTAVIVFFLWLNANYPLHKMQSFFVFVCIAISGLLADLLKIIFAHSRPKLFFSEGIDGFQWFQYGHDLNSFPSGHATTMGALTAALCILFPTARIPVIVTGILIAATRFIIHAHYFSDVIMGYTLGVCSVFIIKAFFDVKGIRLKPREREFA